MLFLGPADGTLAATEQHAALVLFMLIGVAIARLGYIMQRARSSAEDSAFNLQGVNQKLEESLKLLSEGKQELEALYDNAPLLMLVVDEERRIVKANKYAEKVLGASSAQLLNMRGGEALGCLNAINDRGGCGFGNNCDSCRLRQGLLKTLGGAAGDQQFENTMQIERSDRKGEYTFLTSTSRISIRGTPLVLITMQDITERKRAEKRRVELEAQVQKARKLESIGILAGGIAHDFNNLMSGVFGYVDIARQFSKAGFSSDKVCAQLDKALDALDRARDLTRRLLTFSKGGDPIRQLVTLPSVLREVSDSTLAGSKVELRWGVAADLWPCKIDKTQFLQAFNNVLVNAKEAMGENGTLTIKGENLPASSKLPALLSAGDYVRIVVEDTGLGIAEADLPHVFDPFFSTKDSGRGLGLSITYSVIKRHGGIVTVKSEAGKGAAFAIFLPAVRQDRERPQVTLPGLRNEVIVTKDMARSATGAADIPNPADSGPARAAKAKEA